MPNITFTANEVKAMGLNRVLGDIDVDPSEDPYTALGVLLDNSTWDRAVPPQHKAALASAIRKLADYTSKHYAEENI